MGFCSNRWSDFFLFFVCIFVLLLVLNSFHFIDFFPESCFSVAVNHIVQYHFIGYFILGITQLRRHSPTNLIETLTIANYCRRETIFFSSLAFTFIQNDFGRTWPVTYPEIFQEDRFQQGIWGEGSGKWAVMPPYGSKIKPWWRPCGKAPGSSKDLVF